MQSDLPEPLQKHFRQSIDWIRDHLLNHAELNLRQILAAAPGHAPSQRFLGIVLVKLGQVESGVAMLRAATASSPGDEGIRSDLSVALGEVGAPSFFSTDDLTYEFKFVDYPYRSTIRHGSGRPSHPELEAIIESGRTRYETVIDALGEMKSDFADVAFRRSDDQREPFWINGWFPPLDAMALTHFLRRDDPVRFVEIGSGLSTKFARRAVELYGLRTHLTSIDPQPRHEIDALCDEVVRQPLEETDIARFASLEPGDFLFVDSSHRCMQGSDVAVFFMEVLPRIKRGVIIHVHDIYLPDDYLSGHVRRLWNEQYLLATALLFGQGGFEILFPCWFVHQDRALHTRAAAAMRGGSMGKLNLYGASFWFTKV
jgi:hypothetical protein